MNNNTFSMKYDENTSFILETLKNYNLAGFGDLRYANEKTLNLVQDFINKCNLNENETKITIANDKSLIISDNSTNIAFYPYGDKQVNDLNISIEKFSENGSTFQQNISITHCQYELISEDFDDIFNISEKVSEKEIPDYVSVETCEIDENGLTDYSIQKFNIYENKIEELSADPALES